MRAIIRFWSTNPAMRTTQVLVLLVALCAVAQGKRLVFDNLADYTIWIGSQGNADKPPINGGGWEMGPHSSVTIDVDDSWAGRFWGRTGCFYNGAGEFQCETGNCGLLECQGRGGAPPVTLAEFTFNGWQAQDFYDISLVDGSNIQSYIMPLNLGGGGPDPYRCAQADCPVDINPQCPDELRQVVDGRTVGCKSACLAFDTDEYCCRGAHNTPETCVSSTWPVDYPAFFKRLCPLAYSYAYDDNKSTFTCDDTGYRIQFG